MSSAFGTLPASFAINPDGGASYSIPIPVPPGTAQMQPKLSIEYDSGRSNDLLGVGWSLRGLSAITRCAATVAQDGFTGVVQYGPNDRFALDGKRLMIVEGSSYGSADSSYRTEVESWRRVVPVFASSPVAGRSGPDSFLVYEPDGRVLEYGFTPDSQVEAGDGNPSVRVWALNKITDRNGNSLTISYQQDNTNNNYYPDTISYTENQAAGLSAQRSVVFGFESRQDVCPAYIGGYVVAMTQRLASIQTYLDGALVMTNTFEYQYGAATGRSQLVSVTRSDALGVALPATRFAWQDAAPGIFAAPVSFDSAQANAGGQLIPIDVNGDGCVDFLYACAGPQRQLQLTLFMAQPGQFALSSPITIPVTDLLFGGSLLPMDVNGDGCVDLVYAVDDNGALGLTLFLANRQPDGSWTLVQGPANGAGPSGVVFGSQLLSLDIDGDGRVDLVSTSNSRGMLELLSLLSTDSGFVLGTSMTTGLSYGGQCLAMDVNGDGMTDLVYAHESDGALALAVFLATVDGSGAGFSAPISELASTSGLPATGTLIPLDINGDGLIDLAYAHSSDNDESFTITTLLSTGTSFVNASSISPTTGANTPLPWTGTLLPMDVNGDGQIDLVVVSGNGDQVEVTVLLSQGSGFAQVESVNQFSTSTSWGGSCLPIDLAGRGLTDLLYVSAANNQLSLCALPASGPFSDLLIGITNGLGGTYSIRYAPLTDPSVYTRGSVATAQQIDPQGVLQSGVSGATYAPPSTSSSNFGASTAGSTLSTQLADFPKYIVQSYVESDGRGGDYSYSHAYASALLDLTGRGWLGFATVARTDPQAQTTCLSTYNQLFPLTGTTASRATSRSTDAAAMSCTSFTYAAVASQYSPASGPISTVEVVQKSQQTVQVYTFGTLDDTYVTEYAHDSYGNIVLTSILGDGSVPPLYDIESYQNNVSATTWQIGFRTSLIRANDPRGDDCLTKEAWTYASGTMNVATRQRVVDPGAASPTVLTTSYGYDAFGNRITVTDPSKAVTSYTYDDVYHTFLASKTSPPNQAGSSLTSRYQTFAAFGVGQSRTDPNGVTWSREVDGFGRLSATLGPDPQGKTVTLTSHAAGQDSQGIYFETSTLTGWSGSWSVTRRYRDGLSRSYRIERTGPNDGSTVVIVRTFDSRNHVVSESLPQFSGDANPSLITRSYDNYGRQTQEVTPAFGGQTVTTTWTYPATTQMVKTVAAGTSEAQITRHRSALINGRARLVEVVDANSGVTTFVHDAIGRLVSCVDPIQVVTTLAYDGLGRRVSTSNGTAAQTVYSVAVDYDDLARQVTLTNADGSTVVQVYDALGRVVTQTSTANRASTTTTLTYDNAPTYGLGRLGGVTAATKNGPNYSFDYDPAGRQCSIAVTLAGEQYTFGKTYTPTGKDLTISFAGGSIQQNQYNASGQLVEVCVQDGSGQPRELASFSDFTPRGRPCKLVLANGVTETRSHDALGQLITQQVAAADQVLRDVELSWSLFGTVASITDLLSAGNSQGFSYDPLNRLTRASGGYGSLEFGYDANGNVKLKDGIEYTSSVNQVTLGTSAGETVYSASYDKNGSLASQTVAGQTSKFSFNPQCQLVSAGAVSFQYDYCGRRVLKQVGDDSTSLYPAPYFELIMGADGSAQQLEFVTTPYGRIAVLSSTSGSDAQDYFLHSDHLRSVVLVTDATGQSQGGSGYAPFGSVVDATVPAWLTRRFTGAVWDSETGLYCMGARYYDPERGRFLSADDRPSAHRSQSGALNPYAYVLNSPTNLIDPSGHSIWSDIGNVFKDDAEKAVHSLEHDVIDPVGHFMKQHWTDVVSYAADTVLIAAGVVLIAAAPLGTTTLGSMLLGAGAAGLTMNIEDSVTGKSLSWAAWGEQLGIGAAGGLLSGGAGEIAGVAADAAADAGDAAFEVGQTGRFVANAIGNGLGNFLSGIVTSTLDDVAAHQSISGGRVIESGMFGAAIGVAGSLGGDAVSSKLADDAAAAGSASASKAASSTMSDLTRGVLSNLPSVTATMADDLIGAFWHPHW